MSLQQWGWNARGHSAVYLAYEFAQAKEGEPITDGQIDMFIHWYYSRALPAWPTLPKVFINHSELAAGIADGKTDAARRGAEAIELRQRILKRVV